MPTAIGTTSRAPSALDMLFALQKPKENGDDRQGGKDEGNEENPEKSRATSGNLGTIVDTVA